MEQLNPPAVSSFHTIAMINEFHGVYLVQDPDTGKIYVKKVLDVYNPEVYEFLLQHPVAGTPGIIACSEEAGRMVLIEEYISGSSLQEKIEGNALSEADILRYMLDLCDILEKLHTGEQVIIHRDIKPSNIIITTYNRAVLLDFNAAKFYSPESAEDTVLLGTKGYAAPEQYGFGSSSPQTDIYALGMTLQKMLGLFKAAGPQMYPAGSRRPLFRHQRTEERAVRSFADRHIRKNLSNSYPVFTAGLPKRQCLENAAGSLRLFSDRCLLLQILRNGKCHRSAAAFGAGLCDGHAAGHCIRLL